MAKYPPHLTPTLEEEGLPRGILGESCAIMAYLCNRHGLDRFYPTDPGERAMVDNAMFYYRDPLPARRAGHLPGALRSRSTRARWATSAADDAMKSQAQQDAEAALAEPLDVYRTFFLDGRQFIGGDTPSIADIRLVRDARVPQGRSTTAFPSWTSEYMAAVESALGDAYSEPGAGRARLHRLREAAVRRSPPLGVRRREPRRHHQGAPPTFGGRLVRPAWRGRLPGHASRVVGFFDRALLQDD